MATWYREVKLRPRLKLCIFNVSFAWLPTLGKWTCWKGVCGYTLDWLWWSIGYHIDIEMPMWRRAQLRRKERR